VDSSISNSPASTDSASPVGRPDWFVAGLNLALIHKNDLARAMVAQTEQAFLAIAHANAPKEPTVKMLEYKGHGALLRQARERRAFFERKQRKQLTERAKHQKATVKMEMMRMNRPTQQTSLARGLACIFGSARA
jgi:hypothetical protein